MSASADPIFFATPAKFRAWLSKHHRTKSELIVGFYKKKSGKPSITWQESVDEALCFGWIDGIRRSLDDERYSIRFTPRRSRSVWSIVNIRRAKELIEVGLMHPAGLAAFEARADERSAIYFYEQRRDAKLDPAFERRFRANKRAWESFRKLAPSQQRAAAHWVMSAKKAETRERRLALLIEESAKGRTPKAITPPKRSPSKK